MSADEHHASGRPALRRLRPEHMLPSRRGLIATVVPLVVAVYLLFPLWAWLGVLWPSACDAVGGECRNSTDEIAVFVVAAVSTLAAAGCLVVAWRVRRADSVGVRDGLVVAGAVLLVLGLAVLDPLDGVRYGYWSVR